MRHGHSHAGRPRDADIDRRVADATLEVLRDRGYAGLSIDKVASAAGVTRATVYLRHPNKSALIAHVLRDLVPPLDIPDTGTPLVKVAGAAVELIIALQESGFADTVFSIHAQARRDPLLAQAVMSDYLGPRGAQLDELLNAARDSGELACDVPIDLARDLLFGPVVYRWLVVGDAVDRPLARRLVNVALTAIAADCPDP